MIAQRIPSLLLFLFVLLLSGTAIAQAPLQLSGTRTAPEIFRFLNSSDDVMRDDQAIVEAVLDRVDAWTVDSIIVKERQHLSGIYGVMGRMLARYWKKLDSSKRKYIGTSSRSFKVYEGFAKEVDMNIFLMPHLDHYIDMALEGFEQAFEKGRNESAYRYDNPAYPSSEKLKFKDLGYLTVECELTPAAGYRESLAESFIPTSKGKHDLNEQGNFGVKHPSFGLYGPWVMDCNHNCRPEIHPIEWMWWLDMSTDRPGGENAKSWMIGLFSDDSKRFRDWTPSPITGQISIPVAFPSGSHSVKVVIQHLESDTLFEETLVERIALPENGRSGAEGTYWDAILRGVIPGSDAGLMNDTIAGMDSVYFTNIEVKVEGKLPGDGFRWWWGDLYSDPVKGMTFGELKIAVSANKLYTGRVTVDFE